LWNKNQPWLSHPRHGARASGHPPILAILLDDIEMFRDLFMKKQEEEPKVGDGFRNVVGTGAWQKLKETTAVGEVVKVDLLRRGFTFFTQR